MAYGTPANPVAGTVITVAYAVTNILDPIRWLRLMTGNADPPGTAYTLVSSSTTSVSWAKVSADALAAGAALGNIAPQSITNGYLGTDAVDDRVLGPGAALANIGAQGITNGHLGTDTVDNRVLGPGAALANIGADGMHGATYIQPGTVTNAELAAGVARDNLGYTPINKGGDSGVTGFAFGSGQLLSWPQEVGVKLVLTPDQQYALGVESSVTYLRTPQYVGCINYAAGGGDWSLLHDTANHILYVHGNQVWHAGHFSQPTASPGPNRVPIADGSGKLDAWVTAGGGGGGSVAEMIPGMVLGWIGGAGAVPTGWTRFTEADGRLLVGAGQVGEHLFAENVSYGANWSHQHGAGTYAGSASASLGVTGSATGGPEDNTGGPSATNGLATPGGQNLPTDNHTHSLSGVSFAVGGTASGTVSSTISGNSANTAILPPVRALVWIRKT